ncbi:MAG: type II CAAX endopeptidase family protein [Devosia sp.]
MLRLSTITSANVSPAAPALEATANRTKQIIIFVVLAYALSWWPWLFYMNDPGSVDAPILPIGPLIALITVAGIFGSWPALRDLLRKVTLWRVGWQWYAVALVFPVVVTVAAVLLNMLFGASIVDSFSLPSAPQLIVRFGFIFLWIGLGEELGWRGFVLPRLLQGRSALVAALILGVIHAVWHWPLLGVEYDFANILPWGISVFCFSIVICWIWLKTGGSVLMAMLMHASNNTIAVLWRMFEGGDQIHLWWIWCALWVAFAGAVVAINGIELGRKEASSS